MLSDIQRAMLRSTERKQDTAMPALPGLRWDAAAADELARLRAVVSIQQEVATSDAELPALLALVVRRALELTGAAGAAIRSPEGDDLVCRAAAGSAIDGTLAGLAYRDRRVIRRADSGGALMAVPLVSSQSCFGVLEVASPSPSAFDDEQEQTLRLLGGILATRLDLAGQIESRQELLASNTIAMAALRESESRFRGAFDESAIGMALVGIDGRWLKVNAALCRIVGHAQEELLAHTFRSITHPDDVAAQELHLARILNGELDSTAFERRYLHRAGRTIWVAVTLSAVRSSQGRALYVVAQVQDITARKAAEDELHRHATRDGLTGLINRREMDRLLAEELSRSRRHGHPLSLLLVDADKFKQVNDSFGHQAGDFVLQQLATVIGLSVRAFDSVARYGGEELAVILPETSAEEALVVAERIRATVAAHPFSFSMDRHAPTTVTVSVGVAGTSANDAITPEQLLAAADRALYAAKRAGRNRSESAAA
jgi:diguanylate cyclase (GGDEF)-like protein/PAS domain S-box-containing protein